MGPHKAWHYRGYVPLFDAGAVVQALTFRLVDSLPTQFFERVRERDDAKRRRRLEAIVDEGRGSCLLRDVANASIVRDALKHFDGERYRLIAWAIMPNHVHAMIEQIEGHALGDILHSWKSFTTKEINRKRGMTAIVWSPDHFDRFVPDENHYSNAISYIENNPVKAGLARRPEDWPFSSATRRPPGSAGILPAGAAKPGADAATPD